VIPLLLAHPDMDVNVKNSSGSTPFYIACYGRTSCVRELLKDSRVKVNEPDNYGRTPLWWAARDGYHDLIKVWIASGREMDLGTPGDVEKTDSIGAAKMIGKYDDEAKKKMPPRQGVRSGRNWESPVSITHFSPLIKIFFFFFFNLISLELILKSFFFFFFFFFF